MAFPDSKVIYSVCSCCGCCCVCCVPVVAVAVVFVFVVLVVGSWDCCSAVCLVEGATLT